MMMGKKMLVAALLVCFIFSQMETVKPDASDCLDACQTACVDFSKPDRERQRCDAKCVIRCGPASASEMAEGNNQNIS